MPHVFEYAVLRAVPRQDRGEFMNVGVHALLCAALDFLAQDAMWPMTGSGLWTRYRRRDLLHESVAEAPGANACDGSTTGPVEQTTIGQRFRWLTAPRSTMVQTSPAHTGFTEDPSAEVTRPFRSTCAAAPVGSSQPEGRVASLSAKRN